MRALTRCLAFLVGLLSIAVFGLCLVGIAEVWAVRQSALEGAADIFDRADGILDRTARGASEIRAGLENARANLREIKEAPAAKNSGGREPGFLGKRAARAVAQELTAKMGDVRRTTDRVAETAVVLESLLQAVNKLPFTSANQLATQPLQRLQDRLPSIIEGSRTLSAQLGDAPANDGGAGDPTAETTRLEESLQRVLALSADFQSSVARLQDEVSRLRVKVVRWIGLASLLVTGMLAWVALSQLSLLAHASTWFRRAGAPLVPDPSSGKESSRAESPHP